MGIIFGKRLRDDLTLTLSVDHCRSSRFGLSDDGQGFDVKLVSLEYLLHYLAEVGIFQGRGRIENLYSMVLSADYPIFDKRLVGIFLTLSKDAFHAICITG